MMDESVDLIRHKATSYLALAAVSWFKYISEERGVSSAREALSSLSLAAAYVSRVNVAMGGDGLLTTKQLITAFGQPLSEWLIGGPKVILLEGDEPTPFCEDVALSAGSDPAAEVEQQILLTVMDGLGRRADGPARYTEFRRFLIENPVVEEGKARAQAVEVGIALSRLYEPIGLECQPETAQEPCFYPCPRCGWPMRVSSLTGRVACRAERCQKAGARFLLRDKKLVPMGRYHSPAPRPVDGVVRLLRGVWRYTLQPGLAERDLAKDLLRIPGVEVDLWPELDLYDLDVRYGDQRWRVDVKDHHSARSLAEHLRAREPRQPIYIVVPNDRKDQRQQLQRLCGTKGAYRFHTSSSFLRLVRKAAHS